MSDLSQLVYVSRRDPGVTTAEIIDAIVLPAMRRNRALDITGCLWFGAHRFLQVLEGEPREVKHLFERIRDDPRHYDIRLISSAPIDERSFARFALKHIESDELHEVNLLIARFAPDTPPAPAVDDARGPTGALHDTLQLIHAVIARLRGSDG